MVDYSLTLLSKKRKNQWNELVENAPQGGFFHSYEYLQVLEKGLGLKPLHLLLSKNGGVVGGIPNFLVPQGRYNILTSLPIPPSYGGPILTKKTDQVLDLLFDGLNRILQQEAILSHQIYLSVRSVGLANYLSRRGYVPKVWTCRFILHLDEIYRNLSRRRQRDIAWISKNIQNKEGVCTERYKLTQENINTFFLLYEETCKALGVSPVPLIFFRSLPTFLDEEDVALFFLSTGEKIAGQLCFLDQKNKSVHPLFLGSKRSAVREFKSHICLYDSTIRWAQERGFETYDFGATSPDLLYGLYNFKREFGGIPLPDLVWVKEAPSNFAPCGIFKRIYRTCSQFFTS
ncbi:MAG: GNAT family N-acetyltransferase [Candidatus Korarchaeota archaeon]|nr:GNAT family N-acetyltransferase [Candidatus Korarchaeota archaeon]NIU84403.1 GNAT family N-acetyltransferase [Candidatus Thorarchaeota archaeon]NIW14512.1 GNAT family N-acetyltransferase [Candidatus Thorarchaeota archaeon]NIW52591.1 GNAT family N-acetyltransferase [Candidatus Korarchaeota archaeon]